MQYVGIQTQQSRNNVRSAILLSLFPALVVGLTYLFCFLLIYTTSEEDPSYSRVEIVNEIFLHLLPYVIGGVLIWFLIAYFANTSIINAATGAHPLERKENKRIYNLVENLCISKGMQMPKINVIPSTALNAYASGINKNTYTVTLTQGIIDRLDDQELEAVIAHELTHIRNNDVRVLIISIVFVGIFTIIAEIALRSVYYSSATRRKNDKGGGMIILLLALLVAALGYFFGTIMRFAISRNREYMADAGAAEMTKNPAALASALRKIAGDPVVNSIKREDVAQLFIEHPTAKAQNKFSSFFGLFATHPPIEKRIEILEQF